MLCFYLYVDAAEKHKSDEQAKVKGLVKQVKAKVKGSSDVDKDTGLVENVMPKKVKKARLVDTDVAVKNLTLKNRIKHYLKLLNGVCDYLKLLNRRRTRLKKV